MQVPSSYAIARPFPRATEGCACGCDGALKVSMLLIFTHFPRQVHPLRLPWVLWSNFINLHCLALITSFGEVYRPLVTIYYCWPFSSFPLEVVISELLSPHRSRPTIYEPIGSCLGLAFLCSTLPTPSLLKRPAVLVQSLTH
jgi:hypothetical protein